MYLYALKEAYNSGSGWAWMSSDEITQHAGSTSYAKRYANGADLGVEASAPVCAGRVS